MARTVGPRSGVGRNGHVRLGRIAGERRGAKVVRVAAVCRAQDDLDRVCRRLLLELRSARRLQRTKGHADAVVHGKVEGLAGSQRRAVSGLVDSCRMVCPPRDVPLPRLHPEQRCRVDNVHVDGCDGSSVAEVVCVRAAVLEHREPVRPGREVTRARQGDIDVGFEPKKRDDRGAEGRQG